MTQPFTPTPDMLAILAEVEGNPRSKFLKLPIHLGNPGAYAETLSGKETFLTSAEKKLVRSYRDELETWLFYRGQEQLANSNWGRQALIQQSSFVNPKARPQVSEKDIQKILPRVCSKDGVRANFSPDSLRSQDPAVLLGMAQVLIRRASTRVSLGLASLASHQNRAAADAFGAVLASGNTPRDKQYAADNLGLACLQAGDLPNAAGAYALAGELAPGWVDPRMSAMICEAFLGNWAKVRGLGNQLAHLGVDPTNKSVESVSRAFSNGPGKKLFVEPFHRLNLSELAAEILSPFMK